MKFIITLAVLISLNAHAQTSYKKVSRENLKDFNIGKAPEKCDVTNEHGTTTTEYITATQVVTLNLKDGSSIVVELKSTERDDREMGDYRDYCKVAKRKIQLYVQNYALRLFSMLSGDVSVKVVDQVKICSTTAINFMLEGNLAINSQEIPVLVKCP